MEISAAPKKAPNPTIDEELTDEQIDKLLARASERLQAKKAATSLAKKEEAPRYNLQKLNPGKLVKPYVSTQGDIAIVNATRLVDEKQQKQANGIRKVIDPVAAKKLSEEVC